MIEAAVRTCTAMLLAAAGLATQDGESPEALQVMSFNIRYGTARDGGDHWDRRRELVASPRRHQGVYGHRRVSGWRSGDLGQVYRPPNTGPHQVQARDLPGHVRRCARSL